MKKMGYAKESNKSISLLGVKQHERDESKTAIPHEKPETSKAVKKVEQRKQTKQAKPLKEELSAPVVEAHVSQKNRGQGKRKILKGEHEPTPLKHVKHEALTKASEQNLAANGTEAEVASVSPRWLS